MVQFSSHYFVFSDNVTALFDCWLIGDGFLTNTMSDLFNIRKKATVNKKPQPYLFQRYNVKAFTPESTGIWGINRFLSPLITALNNNHHLPKIVLVIPDYNILSVLPSANHTIMFIGAALHYLIKQMDLAVERR